MTRQHVTVIKYLICGRDEYNGICFTAFMLLSEHLSLHCLPSHCASSIKFFTVAEQPSLSIPQVTSPAAAMVQGVMVCGTFVTKNTLTIIEVVMSLLVFAGTFIICFGGGMQCSYDYHYYDDYCHYTKQTLIINGGVILCFAVIMTVVVGVLSCKVKESPEPPAAIVTQPYTVPGQAVIVQPQTAFLYNQANPSYPKQYQSTAATTSEAAALSHHNQDPPPAYSNTNHDSDYPQKHHPETTTTMDLPPTPRPN